MSATATLSAMYQDAILAHYRAPHNRREVQGASVQATRSNPLCGDEVTVSLRLRKEDGGGSALPHADRQRVTIIDDVAFGGRACSIATASASMMTDAVHALSVTDALTLTRAVEEMIRGANMALSPALDALRGVVPFPARHGCALMPWLVLRDALASMP